VRDGCWRRRKALTHGAWPSAAEGGKGGAAAVAWPKLGRRACWAKGAAAVAGLAGKETGQQPTGPAGEGAGLCSCPSRKQRRVKKKNSFSIS